MRKIELSIYHAPLFWPAHIASDLPVVWEIEQRVAELRRPMMPWRAAVCDYASEGSTRQAAQVARFGSFRVPEWHGHFARIDTFWKNYADPAVAMGSAARAKEG